jgi:hypothetical protein
MPTLQYSQYCHGVKVNGNEPQEHQVGGEPTAEQLELVAWAREAAGKSMGVAHDGLRHLVTLTTALLAGSAALLGQGQLESPCKGIAVVLLLFSLAVSLFGSLPVMAEFDINCPEEIAAAQKRGLAIKTDCLKIASFLLLLAFSMFLFAVFIH